MPKHTRIIEVEINETTTRIAHIEVTSDSPITKKLLEEGPINTLIIDAAESLASEKDGGSETEIRLIDSRHEDRYRFSLDDELDLDALD